MPKQRRIIIVAGPNGAGKTTFAREYLLKEAQCPDFVNVDLIAAGLSPFDPGWGGDQGRTDYDCRDRASGSQG